MMSNSDSLDHVVAGDARPRLPRATTTRMFESDLIEYFSRIHPATPFVVWLPVLGFVLFRSVSRGDLSALGSVGLLAAGVLLWTFTEYVLHRWVFHWVNDTAWGKRIHFLLHGVHHDYPQDRDRLVMPVGFSAPLSVLFYSLFWLALGGPRFSEPVFVGFGLGYLNYDGTHFAIHHFNFKWSWFKKLKRHHMLHHHAVHGEGFGVSSPLWDLVFRTMPRVKKPAPPSGIIDA